MKILYTKNQEHSRIIKKFFDRKAVNTAIEDIVREVVGDVRQNGDRAITKYTKKFDKVRLTASSIHCTEEEFRKAVSMVPADFMASAKRIKRNISEYHKRQMPESWTMDAGKGSKLGEIIRPVESVGIYIPGGTAPLVSTLFMTVIPAVIAGVAKIVVSTPPRSDGTVNPYILAVARMLGVKDVYKIGGAQAIAAMAHGTATVPAVDKIVGPGNAYVTEAKRQVFGVVDIDCIAGPSEIAVLADDSANPEYIAADILSQAEHGTGLEVSVLVTPDAGLADAVQHELKKQLSTLGRKKIMAQAVKKGVFTIVTRDIGEAVAVTNSFAPEHLEIMTRKPGALVKSIKNAGAIFIGKWSPVPVGDFIAGPSHVLPTNNAARAFSGLSVQDFIKRMGTIEYTRDKLESIENDLGKIASVEGLDAHIRTVSIRRRRKK